MNLLAEILLFIKRVEEIGVPEEMKEVFTADAHELSIELRKESSRLADEFDIWASSKLSDK